MTTIVTEALAMLSTESSRFFTPLLLVFLVAGCPPFDKPAQDSADGGSDDSSGAGAAGGDFVGTPVDGGRVGATGSGAAGGTIKPTPPSSGTGAAADGGGADGDDWSGFPGGDPFGNDGTGAAGGGIDPITGLPISDPGNDPGTGSIGGSSGRGGAIAIGAGDSGSGGGAGADPGMPANTPPAARLAAWGGRWDGHLTFYVAEQVGGNIITGPDIEPVAHQMPAALRIDDLTYDPSTGYGSVTARVAVGSCLLSAQLEGTIFFGDDLSPIANPIVSFQAAGSNDAGQFLSLRLNGKRTANALTGTINLQGVDMLPDPCGQKDMAFELDRAAAN